MLPNMVDNAAVETLITVPATPATNMLENASIRFTNIVAVAVTITVYAVPSGGSASTTNNCLNSVSIPPNSVMDVAIPVVYAGGIVQAQAGAANSINAQLMSGYFRS